MSKPIKNIIGNKYNEWTVIDKTDSPKYYICKCSCGNIKKVARDSLVRGTSKCCGCIKSYIKNYSGHKVNGFYIVRKATQNDCIKFNWKRKKSITWYYIVKCKKCGKEFVSDINHLSKLKSCGCEHNYNKFNNIIGKKIGKLTILSKATQREKHKYNHFDSYNYSWCKCECGNIGLHRTVEIIKGNITSCGCQHKKMVSKLGKSNAKDITGKRHGHLTALRPATLEEQKNRGIRKRNNNIYWLCKCDCGNTTIINSSAFKTIISCGCEKSRNEIYIADLLRKNNIDFVQQYNLCVNPKTNRPLKVDFYVNNEYVIEYDGILHYKAQKGFNSEQDVLEQQQRDKIKDEFCKNNNIPIIRIPYTHKNITLKDLQPETSEMLLHG